jgi:hypothetical protein
VRQFEDVTLKWAGVEYTIPADSMMRAIMLIEEWFTLEDLHMKSVHLKRAKISAAFAAVLRYAGAKVTDEEVYAGMFKKGVANTTIAAVTALSMMMVPADAIEAAAKGVEPKKENRRARRAAASSSRIQNRLQAARDRRLRPKAC